ncbi:OOP family OmpA-OmpF porin [Rhodovulum bhavnagarense]|uniref:OOP family OmpA-OmpF porin n=1 Tax=Rhodovulum bhavnagarense TaxID=992286 RepID=A0A4R2RSH6_9RHOB|nr:OmpA family protein [Rhodovulum bhavnagarense]TCP62851.1 OOP family OmpA-OmpF porin [Rhodovulum bhavnagarense]
MTLTFPRILTAATLIAAAALALATSVLSVGLLEKRTAQEVRTALLEDGLTWATVRADGTQVHLSGTAPDEAGRFRALSAAGRVLDSAHVLDEIDVPPSEPLNAPRFSIELLRNEAGISVIGLVPLGIGRETIVAELEKISDDLPVTEMLQIANHDIPQGWQDAMSFGMKALDLLERSKVSVSKDRVSVIAVSDSATQKARIERDLHRAVPDGLEVILDISAPRPVITPFTLRFRMDDEGARFDACTADTEEAAELILDAAHKAGMPGTGRCTLGLGVPAPGWGMAVARGIAAVGELGGGTLTFSDADVSLIAPEGTEPRLFDHVAGALEADLPDVFALRAVLPDLEQGAKADRGPNEFVATLSPEGLVQLRGRVPDALLREAAESYARSRFGQQQVYAAMRIDPALPEGWSLRVLTGLEALSQLRNGSVLVQSDRITLRGLTEDEDATARATRILTDRLGETEHFQIDITYREPETIPDTAPAPELCVAQIETILAEQKINFAPGATRIEGAAVRVVDKIADVLRTCPDARIEIGGHTDSQGREEMNEALSQQRAEAVLDALMARRVLTSNLTAKGYGESQPIADNDTEDGREANRRIAFRLIAPEPARHDEGDTETDDTPETGAKTAGDDADPDDNAAPPEARPDMPSQADSDKTQETSDGQD